MSTQTMVRLEFSRSGTPFDPVGFLLQLLLNLW